MSEITPREQALLKRFRSFQLVLCPLKHSKESNPDTAKREEAKTLEKYIAGTRYIVMDERGANPTSELFASQMMTKIEQEKDVHIVIGGAAGLHPDILKNAALSYSFGKMVWTHDLLRLMLIEQLYRAHEIHRGGKFHKA